MKMLLGKQKISEFKLINLLIMLTLLTGVLPVLAQVTNLGIAPAGGQSLIYWPVSSTNYVLQTTTNLVSPNWVTASNAVTVNAATMTNSAPAGYFRLLAQANTTAGMVLIPAGSFTMGNYLFYNTATNDPDITDANPTNVYVSAFYMDVNLVSYSQWQSVCNYATNNGYNFSTNYLSGVYQASGKAGNHPVQTVDWYDCVKWSNARSQQAGLVPVYYTDAGLTQVFTNGDNLAVTVVYQNTTNNGYRLPTEAEWEKAARGGLSGLRFPWGNSISASQANYYGNTNDFSYDLGPDGFNTNFNTGGYPLATYTSPVGFFAPNGYGLYDMAGNVSEWCSDWYGTPYGQPSTINPTGAGSDSNVRVIRGGTWDSLIGGNLNRSLSPSFARCAFRSWNYPDLADTTVGFRCVRGF